ncbi:MAG: peptidoglycan DD-metalloendopeptidase family protein, partial [Bacteroidales bacterium]|nr:peptidoglycan DD-metalloendopeptidase family protein [Bacteroidales bacterium]
MTDIIQEEVILPIDLDDCISVTSNYGYRTHPITGKIYAFHGGIDIAVVYGTEVKATISGTVIWKGTNERIVEGKTIGFGNTVVIKTEDGSYSTLYGHMVSFAEGLELGSTVGAGDIIGYSGNSGGSTGTHLHYGEYDAHSTAAIEGSSQGIPNSDGYSNIGVIQHEENNLDTNGLISEYTEYKNAKIAAGIIFEGPLTPEQRQQVLSEIVPQVKPEKITITTLEPYTVGDGETLEQIAESNNTTVEKLLETNNIENGEINTGDTIQIPKETETYKVCSGEEAEQVETIFTKQEFFSSSPSESDFIKMESQESSYAIIREGATDSNGNLLTSMVEMSQSMIQNTTDFITEQFINPIDDLLGWVFDDTNVDQYGLTQLDYLEAEIMLRLSQGESLEHMAKEIAIRESAKFATESITESTFTSTGDGKVSGGEFAVSIAIVKFATIVAVRESSDDSMDSNEYAQAAGEAALTAVLAYFGVPASAVSATITVYNTLSDEGLSLNREQAKDVAIAAGVAAATVAITYAVAAALMVAGVPGPLAYAAGAYVASIVAEPLYNLYHNSYEAERQMYDAIEDMFKGNDSFEENVFQFLSGMDDWRKAKTTDFVKDLLISIYNNYARTLSFDTYGKDYGAGEYGSPYSMLRVVPKDDGTGNTVYVLEHDAVAFARDGWHDDIVGSNASDNLVGKDGTNSIWGRGGNDHIEGRANNDNLIGGDGDDKIYGGHGDDVIYGDNGDGTGSGHDYIEAGSGDDAVIAGAGNDTVIGGKGDDQIQLDEGNDYAEGNAGDDVIVGGAGDDIILGNSGEDTIVGEDGADLIFGGEDNDTIDGGAGDDMLYGDAGNDTINGGDGNDELYGGAGVDVLNGQAGDDIL